MDVVTDPSAAQVHVFIGHLGITRKDPDYYTLLVMDNVLGTGPGFTDRLSANLRDRQGLAYTVTAQITGSATNHRSAGHDVVRGAPSLTAPSDADFAS